ncbi:MAG: MarC family protein [Bacteroidales bacterium]
MFGFWFMVFAALFSVVNPFGTLPVFISITQYDTKRDRNKTALRASIFMIVILLIFFLVGTYIMNFFGISISSLRITGGIIIGSSGFALLTGNFSKHKGMNKKVEADAIAKDDSSISPLAIPMLAGPGAISLLISYSNQYPAWDYYLIIISAILFTGFLTYLILRSAQIINKRLGATGLSSLSRLIGFIVIAIGVEYIISAVYEIADKL